ncbi:hypothetical protein [Mesorhizobium sp. M0674]|uniref:hypothetical protein n=1 Tax=unclassified Mesorhizobium TaxID=325217 RepID=UPI00333DFC13
MRAYLLAITVISTLTSVALAKDKSIELDNQPTARTKSSVTMTANVTNKSRTAVKDGAVSFDNEWGVCVASFGAIAANGGTATSTCVLDGYALAAKVAFNGADGTGWFGLAGDGTAFEDISINLNDHK